jgi:hypothetical protein
MSDTNEKIDDDEFELLSLGEQVKLAMRFLEAEGEIVRTGEMRPGRDGKPQPVFILAKKRH